jgi:hypothetical protein
MKAKYSLLIIAGLVLCFFACKKDANNIGVGSGSASNQLSTQTSALVNPTSIVGNWNIVTDSTFAGAGITNHAVDYAGQAGDYFNISANGHIYTKEGSVLDTLSYGNVSDTTIIISPFGITLNGVPETSHIITFTAHSLIINAPEIATPGGIFGRKVSLSR